MYTKTYSRLFGEIFATDEEAKAAREADYQMLRKDGIKAIRSVLKNQVRPYASYGVADGRSCNCYDLTVI